MNVNDKISRLNPYIPSKRYAEHNGWDYCDWNESQFSPSPLVFEAVNRYILNDNIEKYPCSDNKELSTLLSSYTGVPKKNISVYNGSDEALKDIFLCFSNHNAKVLTYNPSYTQVDTFIAISTSNHHIEDILNPLGKHAYNFKILKDYDIVYIANPNNPTGYIIEKEKVEQILYDNPETLFIIDEAYYEFSNVSCCDLVLKYDNLLVTRTFSKAFGLASLRIGYVIGSENRISFLNKIRNVKSVNAVAQVAAIASLKDMEYLNTCVSEVKKSREALIEYINKSQHLDCSKSHSNFVLVRTTNSERVIKKMIDNKILIRDRSYFKNLENCVRITVGKQETTNKIIEVLESVK